MKQRRVLFVWLALLHCAVADAYPVAAATVSVTSRQVLQGEIVELKIAGGLTDVKGRVGKETIYFYPAAGAAYAAIVGVDLEAKPGPLKVTITGTAMSGRPLEREVEFYVKAKAFQREELTVAAEFDQLSPEVLERIRRERERLDSVFAASSPARLWEGPFVQPVAGGITSPFGYRRVVNGLARAPHTGTDLRAALGTEVGAANHGRVVFLGDFFFSGKSLVLDHGAGLFTLYFHLSEFKAPAGGLVRKADIIGLSGMSGRVTGPHLHWGARINKARIDPFALVEKLGGKSEPSSHPEVTATKTEK